MTAAPGLHAREYRSPTDDRRIVQGADNLWVLSFDESFGADWSGYAARGQLRRRYADFDTGDALCPITCTIVAAGPTYRAIQFWVPYSRSAGIGVQRGVWDCEIYNGTFVQRVVMGPWELNRETTR